MTNLTLLSWLLKSLLFWNNYRLLRHYKNSSELPMALSFSFLCIFILVLIMCMGVYAHMSAGAHGFQKGAPDSLGLQFRQSPPAIGPGHWTQSSARVASSLNYWATLSAPPILQHLSSGFEWLWFWLSKNWPTPSKIIFNKLVRCICLKEALRNTIQSKSHFITQSYLNKVVFLKYSLPVFASVDVSSPILRLWRFLT